MEQEDLQTIYVCVNIFVCVCVYTHKLQCVCARMYTFLRMLFNIVAM